MDEKFYVLQKSNAWDIIQTVANELRPLLNKEISIEEKLFMTIPLAGMRTPTDLENISKMELKQNIDEVVEEIIASIGYELNLYLKKDNLQKDFYYHISFMVNRLQFGYVLKNPLAEEITKKYPLAYKMAKIAAKVVEEKYHVTVPEDEVGYITLHVHTALTREHVVQSMDVARMIQEGIQTIEKELGAMLDDATISYTRLLTHMKFMILRVINDEKLHLDMTDYVLENFPDSFALAKQICSSFEQNSKKTFPNIEISYFAIHIERVKSVDE